MMIRTLAGALRTLALGLILLAAALVVAVVVARRPSDPPTIAGRWRELSPPDFK